MYNKSILKIENLSINYYTLEGIVKAVRNIELEVGKGESVCIVGESGSGKSTLGLAIALALPPNAKIISGKIFFEGRNVLEFDDKALNNYFGKSVSMIFQDPSISLNPLFTIGEQMSDIIRNVLGIQDKKQIMNLMIDMLKKVGLFDFHRILKSYPHELSGGMLQRVCIAFALIGKPKLLIADEPTSMLDVTLQAQILRLLKQLKEEMNLSLLFITHNLGVAFEIADKITVMYAGKIVEIGPAEDVIMNPLHPYTIKLLESIPKVSSKEKRLKTIQGFLPDLRNPPTGCPFADRCDFARSICFEKMPDFIEVRPNHKVACFNYFSKE